MLQVFARLLALVVALTMMLGPGGLAEAAENAAHLAVSGHVAHDGDVSAKHSHEDLEHGCVGGFHVCACCGHQPMLFAEQEITISAPSEFVASPGGALVVEGPPGTRVNIFRPPIG